ncbi:type III pantothenate kinase [Rheinheimera sp. WS51]|uniref:type III pantothenate kinase n=1 Tax=Rheinheimera sp. WS51 TaxID=3425886 RepID=UPI003D945877
MFLLIDIGNTRTKAALYKNGALSLITDIDKLEIDKTVLKGVIIASVGAEDQIDSLKLQLNLPHVEWIRVKSQAQLFGVTNSYAIPEKLGVDRWLGLIAAKNRFANENLLIIDAGTAVTIDWLTAEGCHKGGWILPGLQLQQKAVLTNTARVKPDNEYSANLQPGINTAEGLQSGCLAAVVGAIQLAWQTHPGQKIILTGGDSVILSQFLQLLPVVIEPLLIFHGLSYFCE